MIFEDILSKLHGEFNEHIVEVDHEAKQPSVTIESSKILEVCKFLHTNKDLYFDHLSCLSGVDYGAEQNLGVVYHLYSIPFDHAIVLKVKLNRNKPEIPTITPIWKGADWHEREVFDMYGIKFLEHPDLRRILMPADWEGHPLRKDYKEQEKYHGIKVEY